MVEERREDEARANHETLQEQIADQERREAQSAQQSVLGLEGVPDMTNIDIIDDQTDNPEEADGPMQGFRNWGGGRVGGDSDESGSGNRGFSGTIPKISRNDEDASLKTFR
jgi:hypothetical protein